MLGLNYRKLEKEIHISLILKQLRVVKSLAKKNLSRSEWKQAFEKYSHIDYKSSSSQEED